MKNLMVTNNEKFFVNDAKLDKYFHIVKVVGNLKDVVNEARDYIMNDYQLASDPMAGRRERATPHLTILLESKGSLKDNTARDILRIEKLQEIYNMNEEILKSMPESHKNDFGLIDYTLTMSVCDKICV